MVHGRKTEGEERTAANNLRIEISQQVDQKTCVKVNQNAVDQLLCVKERLVSHV